MWQYNIYCVLYNRKDEICQYSKHFKQEKTMKKKVKCYEYKL